MKKARYLGILFLVGGIALLTSMSVCAAERKELLTCITGNQWVEKCIQKHPELLWLADSDVRITEEGRATSESSHSEQLFGKKYIEFDRTMMTLYCLRLILDGSPYAYQEFTAVQPEEVKLSHKSFWTLHCQAEELLESGWEGLSRKEMAQAIETALVLGDMGKSKIAREKFKSYGIEAPDHDDFYGEVMQLLKNHPACCSSFVALSPAARKLLISASGAGHFGHMTHLEGDEKMFEELKQNNLCYWALSFALFVHTCDVAGALGHVNNHSSLVYTESSHKAMQAVAEAAHLLSKSEKTERDAYDCLLAKRASWLGLDPTNRMDRVLTRLGAMLRLFTPEEGTVLQKAVEKLESSDRDRIVAQLDAKQEGRTPTYMPAVLVNLSNNLSLGSSKEQRLSQAVILGLPLISRVLQKHQELLAAGKADPEIPLNFNAIAGVAKTSPKQLGSDFEIDREGNVKMSR